MISIIIPVAFLKPELRQIRQSLTTVKSPIEVIIVIHEDLKEAITKAYPFEKILIAEKIGRGVAFVQGLKHAKGEIILFLHADTLLPLNWDEIIIKCLDKKEVAGGGFSLAFDYDHRFLKFLIFTSDLFFKMTSELWGDRAMFVRSSVIKGQESILAYPLFEDVKLSRLMKSKGKVVLLKEKVITNADRFVKHSMIQHTFTIIVSRIWYAIGGDPERIYKYYYSKD